jgi:hypothetical protein
MIWAETIVVLVAEMGISLTEVMNLTPPQIELLFEGWDRLQKRKETAYKQASKR